MITFLFFILIPIYVGIFYHFVFHNYIAIPFLFIASIFLSLLTIVLLVILAAPIVRIQSHKSKFKHFILRQIAIFVCHLMNLKVSYEGLENIPDGPIVAVGNHKSQVDIIVMYIAMNRPLGFVSKPGVFKVPFVKSYMIGMGCIAMHRDDDREGAKDIIKAIKQVKDGYSMCIFPEGGRKNIETEKIVEYRAGAYKLATKSSAPIVPVTIINSAMVKHRTPFRRTKLKVVVHKPVYKEQYENKNTHEIGDEIKEIINQSATK